MKKILTMALALIVAGNAMALDNVPESGFSWVGFAGMTVSNLKGGNLDPKMGVTFGVKMDYMLPSAYGTYLTAGVDWIHKGARDTYPTVFNDNGNAVNTDVTYKVQAHYLEIPIRVGYRYNISEKLGVFAEVGPYFAIGVTGKGKLKYEDYPDDSFMWFGKKFAWGNMKGIQRFDCGMGLRVGAEYKNMYSLNLGYDWGITDMYTDDYRTAFKAANGVSLSKMKNRSFVATIGFRF
ncbi:MAG: PorT family protein [Bacteroidaceae bacterium]|nr:PorT family protein [Bacteroidaceae bacterium]